jgi:hypothetical protein
VSLDDLAQLQITAGEDIHSAGSRLLMCKLLALQLHRNQLDKQNKPYAEHLYGVVGNLYSRRPHVVWYVIGAGFA